MEPWEIIERLADVDPFPELLGVAADFPELQVCFFCGAEGPEAIRARRERNGWSSHFGSAVHLSPCLWYEARRWATAPPVVAEGVTVRRHTDSNTTHGGNDDPCRT